LEVLHLAPNDSGYGHCIPAAGSLAPSPLCPLQASLCEAHTLRTRPPLVAEGMALVHPESLAGEGICVPSIACWRQHCWRRHGLCARGCARACRVLCLCACSGRARGLVDMLSFFCLRAIMHDACACACVCVYVCACVRVRTCVCLCVRVCAQGWPAAPRASSSYPSWYIALGRRTQRHGSASCARCSPTACT